MTGTPALSSSRRPFGILRSIRAKMGVILFLMAAAFGAFSYMMFMVLDGIDGDMIDLTEAELPGLESAGAMSTVAGHTKDNMIALVVAQDTAAIQAAEEKIAQRSSQLNELIASLDEGQKAEFSAEAKRANDALTALAKARRAQLESDHNIETRVLELHDISDQLRMVMSELSSKAAGDLNKGAVATYNSIDSSLKTLVEHDFNLLQDLLEARAELNLLAGTAVAFGGTKDRETLARLTELATGSDARLHEIADKFEAEAPEVLDAEVLRSASQVLQSVIAQSLFPSETLRRSAMNAREDTDAILTAAVNERVQLLEQAAATASHENGDALRSLMTNEVGFMNKLMEISTWVGGFQVAALDLLNADSEEDIADAASNMDIASMNLSLYEDFGDARVRDAVQRLTLLTDAKTGLAAQKRVAMSAHAAARAATLQTEQTVLEISDRASELAMRSVTSIGGMARDISAEVVAAKRNLFASIGLAIGVFGVALLMIQMMILRPLNRISASTEQLAEGDRSPITGFERASTEIFRIARSLAVFRDGIVEKEEMEQLAAAERAERRAAQDKAVAALGKGMSRLSDGDLTARIDEELSEGYEQLRADFNQTLDTLNETMGQVVETSSSIRNGATEISQASQDLSNRTESQAATLEETAAALDEMTASVRSAAEGARDVENSTNEARAEAEASGEIVQNAVAAMTEIEESSVKISQIISVIDDISFQTNLLALNAGVEAARAGEAGRGFAVVASEVRGLAQRSSDAALEIKTLISDSSKQVERGVELVGKAGGALESILQRVTHISDLISGIATGAQEQSTGLVEINTGMNQLDQVTQQNAAMVEQSTAASQLLDSDAQKLDGLVARFQISRDRGVSASSAGPAPSSWGEAASDDWEVAAAPLQEIEAEPAVETDWSDFNWDDDEPATGTS
ncbi:methyl-accepting chemotaxis protein [Phaeobacter sp. HF9A]|uniref:methyl-accepting chemotaxis protein n=1 Tax=Phaeobacter sp. HF9A TaxID=2721561 RepID=UPI001432163D|nr:methyl-accepting chemotaxis protein [Phaeobacter sp. HF9A]NIZ12768.1 methyl-accepting chemotaxis protein [Phaeobacter sp. HF9A]